MLVSACFFLFVQTEKKQKENNCENTCKESDPASRPNSLCERGALTADAPHSVPPTLNFSVRVGSKHFDFLIWNFDFLAILFHLKQPNNGQESCLFSSFCVFTVSLCKMSVSIVVLLALFKKVQRHLVLKMLKFVPQQKS